jgi:hypothetical protein
VADWLCGSPPVSIKIDVAVVASCDASWSCDDLVVLRIQSDGLHWRPIARETTPAGRMAPMGTRIVRRDAPGGARNRAPRADCAA